MNRTEYVPRGLQIKSAVASDAQKHADEHLVEEGDETPRELDELDCVQNLLSLSQGNWHWFGLVIWVCNIEKNCMLAVLWSMGADAGKLQQL
jgi:hypothetical protein